MVNFFDQYDPATESSVSAPPSAEAARNFFDQYDPPAVAAAPLTGPQPLSYNEFGPVFDASTPEGKAATKEIARGPEKVLEGVTLGMLPHVSAAIGAASGMPYAKGLQDARDFTAQTSKDAPVQSAILEGAGGLLPTIATFGAGAPLVAGAAKALPYGGAMARALLSGGVGAASTAGHDIGSGDTANLGLDTAKGAGIGAAVSAGGDVLGRGVVQPLVNMGSGLSQGIRNIATNTGREGVVGQILREASGGFPDQAATAPVPGLTLRAAQATGNPGLAGLEGMMASEPGMQSGPLGGLVTNGRTPDQTRAIASSLVGSDAGIEPAALVNQASTRGVQAIQDTNDALRGEERAAWSSPALNLVTLDGPALATRVGNDVAAFPASWRNAVTGPQGTLGPYLDELHELGPNASISDINSVRSRLLGAARDAASGPQPDTVTASAAGRMASSVLDQMGNDAAFGSSPSAQNAYAHARDFTRQFNQVKGYNEFNNILHPNSQGNMQGNPEKQFGQFFDMTGGTTAGLDRLRGVADFARQAGLGARASELEDATGQYLKAAVLMQARAGNGLDATGQPATNLATLASTANKLAPAISGSPMTAAVAPDIQAAGNAAELVNRPATLRGSTNSTTYERLKNNDLVSAIVGQSGSSALGAAAGGYGGYKAGEPFGVPAYASIPAGMVAGAAGGRALGPALGRVVSHIPGASSAVTGPSQAIQHQLWQALMDAPSYNRAMATPLLSGPRVGQPGGSSAAIQGLARALLEPSTARAGQ